MDKLPVALQVFFVGTPDQQIDNRFWQQSRAARTDVTLDTSPSPLTDRLPPQYTILPNDTGTPDLAEFTLPLPLLLFELCLAFTKNKVKLG